MEEDDVLALDGEELEHAADGDVWWVRGWGLLSDLVKLVM